VCARALRVVPCTHVGRRDTWLVPVMTAAASLHA